MSRPPVRKTENVKTAPVIGVIGGVFDRMRGESRDFPVGDGPQGAPASPGPGRPPAAPTAMRSMAGPAGRILAFCRPGNPAAPAKRACQSRDSMLYFRKMPIPKKGAAEMIKLRNDHNRIPVQQLSL